MQPGLVLTHKPRGATSFSRVRAFVDSLPPPARWKVCHGGTLDPFAEGLLLFLVGPTTRIMDLLHAAPKTYELEIVWGVETDNGDPTGKSVAEGDPSSLTREQLNDALASFLGWRAQVPPSTSAKKIRGEPAYRLVHRGETVALPPSQVYLHEAHWLEHQLPARSRMRLKCRGGYYVRALARDLGRALGCRAHVASLARTEIGPWSDPGPDRSQWIHGSDVLPWLRRRDVTRDERRGLKGRHEIPRGAILPADWEFPTGFPEPPAHVRAMDGETLFALLREEGGSLVGDRWLAPGI